MIKLINRRNLSNERNKKMEIRRRQCAERILNKIANNINETFAG